MSGGLLHDMEVLTQLDGSACCPRNARHTRAKHRRDGLHARGFAALAVHVNTVWPKPHQRSVSNITSYRAYAYDLKPQMCSLNLASRSVGLPDTPQCNYPTGRCRDDVRRPARLISGGGSL